MHGHIDEGIGLVSRNDIIGRAAGRWTIREAEREGGNLRNLIHKSVLSEYKSVVKGLYQEQR
jgi:hypothetical protein